MEAPSFVNLGTVDEPYWQRASMHCKICGGVSSSMQCWTCLEWYWREMHRRADRWEVVDCRQSS